MPIFPGQGFLQLTMIRSDLDLASVPIFSVAEPRHADVKVYDDEPTAAEGPSSGHRSPR